MKEAPSRLRRSPTVGDKRILRDLCAAYLRHCGLAPRPASDELSPMIKELLECVVALTEKYESDYRQRLEALADSWTLEASLQSSYATVLETLLAGGCNCGRFVTVFIFMPMFLRLCRHRGLSVSCEDVLTWTVDSAAEQVVPWVAENGDWTSLSKLCRDDTSNAGTPRLQWALRAAGSLARFGLDFLASRA